MMQGRTHACDLNEHRHRLHLICSTVWLSSSGLSFVLYTINIYRSLEFLISPTYLRFFEGNLQNTKTGDMHYECGSFVPVYVLVLNFFYLLFLSCPFFPTSFISFNVCFFCVCHAFLPVQLFFPTSVESLNCGCCVHTYRLSHQLHWRWEIQ